MLRFIATVAVVLLLPKPLSASIWDSIRDSIESQEQSIKLMQEKAEKAARELANKKKQQAADRKARQKQAAKEAAKKQKEEQQRLAQIRDMEQLRRETDDLTNQVKDLEIKLAVATGDAAASKSMATELVNQNKLSGELTDLQKEKLRLEILEASQFSWTWFLGFCVALFSAVVAALAATIEWMRLKKQRTAR